MSSPRRMGRSWSLRGTIASAMKTNHWFFRLVLPALWVTCSLIHFHFPGDEYALWVIDSTAGAWVLFLLPNVGDIHQWWVRGSVAGAGALVMVVAGWILCGLNVRLRIWIGLWVVGALAWSGFMMSQFRSPEEALAKNGSWWAYLFSTAMIAVYFATFLAFVGGGVKFLMRKFSKPLMPNSELNPPVTAR